MIYKKFIKEYFVRKLSDKSFLTAQKSIQFRLPMRLPKVVFVLGPPGAGKGNIF